MKVSLVAKGFFRKKKKNTWRVFKQQSRERNFLYSSVSKTILFLFYAYTETKFRKLLKLANFFVIKLQKEMDLFPKLKLASGIPLFLVIRRF